MNTSKKIDYEEWSYQRGIQLLWQRNKGAMIGCPPFDNREQILLGNEMQGSTTVYNCMRCTDILFETKMNRTVHRICPEGTNNELYREFVHQAQLR